MKNMATAKQRMASAYNGGRARRNVSGIWPESTNEGMSICPRIIFEANKTINRTASHKLLSRVPSWLQLSAPRAMGSIVIVGSICLTPDSPQFVLGAYPMFRPGEIITPPRLGCQVNSLKNHCENYHACYRDVKIFCRQSRRSEALSRVGRTLPDG